MTASLTVPELAQRAGVTNRAIYAAIKRGALPAEAAVPCFAH